MDSDKNTLLVLKDPVCGMAVTAQSTHHLKHDNKAFYFCSASCKAKFNDNPSQYLDTQSVIKPSNTTIKTSAIATTCLDGLDYPKKPLQCRKRLQQRAIVCIFYS